jgi:hypothetical protein
VSEENVALVRRNYEVINAIDRSSDEFVDPEEVAPDLWASLAPDFELHGRPDVPDATVYRGREATKQSGLPHQGRGAGSGPGLAPGLFSRLTAPISGP